MKEFIESRDKMEALLREMPFGFLGLSDDGQPYVVPLNHAYVDGRLLFHCALEGKKLDLIAANPHVCYTVARQPGVVTRHAEGSVCHADSESVICTGKARVVSILEERAVVLTEFNRSFRPDAEEITLKEARGCAAVEIVIDEMTGRWEFGRRLTCWRFRPAGPSRA